jgi:hypothetical protein
VEGKWKNYHIITFPGQSLSKTLEEAMDLSQDRLILELELESPLSDLPKRKPSNIDLHLVEEHIHS